MTTYSWASQTLVPPSENEFELIDNDVMLISPFSGAIQTVQRPKLWRMSCYWRNIKGGERADLIAFFAKLNGKQHRVTLPFFGQVQRGELGGTPIVDGASQTGNSINIRGASVLQTDWIKAGDILQWSNSVHMATADADTDASGDVTVSIIPEIRNSPSDATAVDVSATIEGIFILEDRLTFKNSASKRLTDAALYSDLALTFIDDIRGD